jgi:hypothetical protein
MEIKTFVQYDLASDSQQLFLWVTIPQYPNGPAGGSYYAEPIRFTHRLRGSSEPPTPFLGASRIDVDDGLAPSASDFLQAIMDAGWEQGIRPRKFKDHTNELTAVRYHLEDMRALAFETAKPQEKK